MLLENYVKGKNVHMLGIGGISMSGISALLKKEGYNVTGTNNVESHILDKLRELGIEIKTPHFDEGLENADMVVYTAAIKQDDPDMVKAREIGKPIVERADFLGEITKEYKNTICISGMHGKTTTTAMTAVVLDNADYSPTVLVGGEVEQIGGNYKIGNSDILVNEACEYVESFTKFSQNIGVVLNIELEHMDYYKDLNHIKSAFTKFINNIKAGGYLVANLDDDNVKAILPERDDLNIVTFGINNKDADWTAENIRYNNGEGYPVFDLYYKGKIKTSIELQIPGVHNINNALATIAVCDIMGMPMEKIKEGIGTFKGAKRRFELKGTYKNDIKIYDDYAHHPSEIKSTLKALRNREYNHSWCVFQPHTFSRTQTLFDDFTKAFVDCDNVILLDIYPAREIDTGVVSSKMLADAINKVSGNAIYAENFEKAKEILEENLEDNDIVITMGAGESYKVGEKLLKKM